MFAALLIAAVAAGIAWPLLRERGWIPGIPAKSAVPVEGTRPTVSAREELCPYCSRLNHAGAVKCMDCNAQMPVSDLKHLWDGNDKQELMREGVQCGILLVIMLFAMALSYNLPIMGKLVVLLATIAGLTYRFMKSIQA